MRMLLGRIGLGVITLLIAVTATFLIVRSSGSPATQILGDNATPETTAALNAELGLDEPLVVQYLGFLGRLLRGDLGESMRYNQPNLSLIAERMPATIELAAAALLIALVAGVLLGILAASRSGSVVDRIVSGFAAIGTSTPIFWVGLMLMLLFAVTLGLLPAGQRQSPLSIVLPALTLSLLPLAQIARLTRSAMVEALQSSFVVGARARGLSTGRVVFNHALRNSALPVLTMFGLQTGAMLSGAVTVEFVFAWPGLGSLATAAVQGRDFTLVQAIVVVGVMVFVLVNLAVDVLYTLIDPRVRGRNS